MLGGADNPNGELPSYITGANIYPYSVPEIVFFNALYRRRISALTETRSPTGRLLCASVRE